MEAAARPAARALGGARVALLLAAIVLAGAWGRMAIARSDPGFQPDDPVGMLRSDPALLYYVTERVAEADGLFPDDLRHDPRVEHPAGADLAERFTIGQELLVGWTYPALAFGAPLHVHAQRLMALSAAGAAVGVYLFAAALKGRGWGLVAALLWALLPASHRTIGFVLVREDLSLPLFALFGGLAARAACAPPGRGRAAGLGSGFALCGALATWHATTFVAALALAALLALAAVSGVNALAGARGRLAALGPIAAGLLVPALSSRGLLLSAPAVAAAALFAAAAIERRRPLGRARRAAVLAAAAGALGLLAFGAARLGWTGGSELSHVWEVLIAKVRHLGARPADPRAISFDARLLWQGPFETLPLGRGAWELGVALPLGLAGAAWTLARRAPPAAALALVLFLGIALSAAWLFERLIVLPGLALPVLAAAGLAALRPRVARAAAAAALALQAGLFALFAARHEIPWYRPAGLAPELRNLIAAVEEHVPAGEAVLADFITSPAVLAHTRRGIVLHPKYESEDSRRAAEAFLEAFFLGTPEDLARAMRERFRCRYLVVDRFVLGYQSAWTAGLPPGAQPAPGTAAATFLSQDEATLESAPAFELLWRSPPTVLQQNGAPYDLYRLYRLRG